VVTSDKAYNNRGNAYYKKGQYEKTISDYNNAIEINPRFAEAYNNRAFVYFYKRDYEKAWDDVYKALNLGYKVHPGFLNALRQASGREK
jgi:tetratricopeptide (TPR) repeat protein